MSGIDDDAPVCRLGEGHACSAWCGHCGRCCNCDQELTMLDMSRCKYCGANCDGDVCDERCAQACLQLLRDEEDAREDAQLDAWDDADHPVLTDATDTWSDDDEDAPDDN